MSGSETGSEDVGGRGGSGGAGGAGNGGGDLASRTLVLESKRFYLDVKENARGRFIKMVEIFLKKFFWYAANGISAPEQGSNFRGG